MATARAKASILAAALTAASAIVIPCDPARAQLGGPATPAATQPASSAAADVPVKQVVLFSSGVGYFEHFGTVTGDGSAELRFKTDQVNDVLKSLVLQDLDKGQVGTVSYPSQAPIAKTLKSFQVDITANPPLADLLNQLRGARVDVTLADGSARGTIVGVEKRTKEASKPNGGVIEYWLLNLKVGPRFRSIPLDAVRDFALEDPKLDAEMEKALAALADARDQEKKPVTIHFRGRGERRVRVGYVVETPIWKTSYRLVLANAAGAGANVRGASGAQGTEPGRDAPVGPGRPGSPGGAGGAATPATRPAPGSGKLQGWAIVENQTDNDWTDVQLSLVSGRPISFIQDLYHPLYVPRPVVQPELYASLRPQTYEGGMTPDDERRLRERGEGKDGADFNLQGGRVGTGPRRGKGGGGGGGGGGLFAAAPDAAAEPMDPTASVASAASAGQLGELFEYTVGNVSLARQKSAMIPIVADDVEVERLSIYNADVLAKHPLNGARVVNTTRKHLLQGPVTVLEAGGYAGDARIDDVPPGQQRLLSYGVDLNVVADPGSPEGTQRVQTAKVVKGVMEVTSTEVTRQTYAFQNKSDVARTVIVEHPRDDAEQRLVEPPTAEETTDALYRLRTRVEPGKTARLPVRLEQVVRSQLVILPMETDAVLAYVRDGQVPEPVRQALAEVARRKQAAAATQQQISERKNRLSTISGEQSRLRENMKTVAPNTDYYNRLLQKLGDQETQIERIQKEVEELTAAFEKQEKELEDHLAGLTVG